MASLRSSYHPFDVWIAAQGQTREWAADRLQTTGASLSRIINGKQWPGPEFFQRVEALTRGQVTAEHFVNPKKPVKQQPKPESSSHPLAADGEGEPVQVRVLIDKDLLAEAAKLGIDVGALADKALRESIRREKARRWQAEHADIIAWYNDHVEKDGIFGEEWRTF